MGKGGGLSKPKVVKPCFRCGQPSSMQCHLIPKWVAHRVRDGDASLALATIKTPGFEISQSGTYEYGTFCPSCDGVMGKYENRVLNYLDQFDADLSFSARTVTQSGPADGGDIAKFSAGILLKFGVCCDERFKISIGPWADRLQAFVFDDIYPKSFDVMVARYCWSGEDSADHFFRTPFPVKLYGNNFMAFSLRGYRFLCNLDQKPPIGTKVFCYGKDRIPIFGIDLEETPEGQHLFSIQADRPDLVRWKQNMRQRAKSQTNDA